MGVKLRERLRDLQQHEKVEKILAHIERISPVEVRVVSSAPPKKDADLDPNILGDSQGNTLQIAPMSSNKAFQEVSMVGREDTQDDDTQKVEGKSPPISSPPPLAKVATSIRHKPSRFLSITPTSPFTNTASSPPISSIRRRDTGLQGSYWNTPVSLGQAAKALIALEESQEVVHFRPRRNSTRKDEIAPFSIPIIPSTKSAPRLRKIATTSTTVPTRTAPTSASSLHTRRRLDMDGGEKNNESPPLPLSPPRSSKQRRVLYIEDSPSPALPTQEREEKGRTKRKRDSPTSVLEAKLRHSAVFSHMIDDSLSLSIASFDGTSEVLASTKRRAPRSGMFLTSAKQLPPPPAHSITELLKTHTNPGVVRSLRESIVPATTVKNPPSGRSKPPPTSITSLLSMPFPSKPSNMKHVAQDKVFNPSPVPPYILPSPTPHQQQPNFAPPPDLMRKSSQIIAPSEFMEIFADDDYMPRPPGQSSMKRNVLGEEREMECEEEGDGDMAMAQVGAMAQELEFVDICVKTRNKADSFLHIF